VIIALVLAIGMLVVGWVHEAWAYRRYVRLIEHLHGMCQ
jgi:hypothetical protein